MTDETPGTDPKIQTMTRVFRWNGLDLPDPNPDADPDAVREIFAGTYPELATAAIKGPSFEGEQMVYHLQPSAGVKG